MRKKMVYSVMLFSLMFTFISCSITLSDDNAKAQVTEYIKTLQAGTGWGGVVSYSEPFELTNVVVKDKLIKDKESIVLCEITSKCKVNWDADAIGLNGFKWLIGGNGCKVGKLIVSDFKFLFEKYEKGWKLKGYVIQ